MFVYLLENLVNKKLYVGKTKDIARRWNYHQQVAAGGKEKYPRQYSYIHAAIAKHGASNFRYSMLGSYESEEQSLLFEVFFIAQYKADGYQLYNLTEGGDGSSGWKAPMEIRLKISGENNQAAKLTWNEVHKIRELYAQGVSCAALARQFDVERTTVSKICLLKTWKNIPPTVVQELTT